MPDTTDPLQWTVNELPTVNDAGLFMDTTAAAKYLGVAHGTLCRLCKRGEIPAMRVGRLWRIPVKWVAEQLRITEEPATADAGE